jgi:hypothetical protein
VQQWQVAVHAWHFSTSLLPFPSSITDCFSPSERVWASLPLLGAPRSFAAAVGTPEELFVLGGGNGVDWFDSVLRYSRVAGLAGGWQELAPLAVARGSLAAARAGGYLFAFGGGKPKEQYNVVEW